MKHLFILGLFFLHLLPASAKLVTETADYIVSIDGGSPVKITDVTNVPAITSRY